MWALTLKEFRQLRRDLYTLLLLIFVPVILLVVFGYAASFDVDEVPAVVVGPAAETAATMAPEAFRIEDVRPQDGRAEAEAALRDGEATVAVVTGVEPVVLVDGSQLFAARAVVNAAANTPGAPPVEVLFNPDLRTPTVMVPAIIGLILLFVGMVSTSLGVVRERQTGMLEQLAVMPFKPGHVFVGKIAPYLLISTINMVIVTAAGVLLFDVPFRGSVLVFALGSGLFLFVTLGTGVLISTISRNQGQAIQLAIVVLLPQVLLSGMIFPLDSMAPGARALSRVLPQTYFIEISRGVMLRAAPIEALWQPLLALAVLGLVVFGLATLRFRRDLGSGSSGTRERQGASADRPADLAGHR